MPEDGRAVYEVGEREESCIAATTSFLCHFRLLIAASLQHCAAARPTPSARQQLFLQVIGFFFYSTQFSLCVLSPTASLDGLSCTWLFNACSCTWS